MNPPLPSPKTLWEEANAFPVLRWRCDDITAARVSLRAAV